MNNSFKLLFVYALCSVLCSLPQAHAFDYKLSGYGTLGELSPDFDFHDNVEFIGDFRLRAEMNHDINRNNKIGISAAIDELSINQKKYIREGMIFWENEFSRIEVGITDSVAFKLGVGLPDVGGLRINDNSFLFDKMPHGNIVISNPLLSSGRYYPRINLVSKPIGGWTLGVSASGVTDKYKYSGDAVARYRASGGKLKSSVSIGASFIDSPQNFQTDAFSPSVTADYRAQGYVGLNLQYNSFIFGASVRAIYDEKEIGPVSDGIIAGAGLSYDLLAVSISGTYLMSAVGVWDDEIFYDHTGVLSLRYKHNENSDVWLSGGYTGDEPFVSAGIRLAF